MEDNMKRIKKEEEEQQQEVQDGEENIVLPQLPNELILIIVENLDLNGLLTWRLVNSGWKVHADLFLRTKKLTKIVMANMTQSHKIPHLVNANGFLNRNLRLDSLTSTLTNTEKMGRLDKFPCNSFEFQEQDLKQSRLMKFVNLYGSHIHRLELTNYCYGVTNRNDPLTALSGLLVQCPNLEHLVIDKYGRDGMPTFSQKLNLTSPLHRPKKLECHHSEIVEEILDKAVNLESFYGLKRRVDNGYLSFGFLNLNKFVRSNKIDTIQDLSVCVCTDSLSLYEEFTIFQPKLRILKFDNNGNRWINNNNIQRIRSMLIKILESSKDTLEVIKDLDLQCLENQIPEKIPRLSKLNHFGLFFTQTKDPQSLWTLHNSLSDPLTNFSNVTEVSIKSSSPNLFPPNAHLPEFSSVTKLTFYCHNDYLSCRTDILPGQEFGQIFPNVVHLTLKDIHSQNVRTLCQGIWNYMKNLETLDILDVNVTSNSNNKSPSLDSALTGFDPITCETLDGHLKNGTEAEFLEGKTVNELRTSSSILEMTHLKQCTIHVDVGPVTKSWWEQILRPMSLVSIVYGLKLMPQLPQLSLVVRINDQDRLREAKQELAPIVPHLTSVKYIQRR